MKDLKVSLQVNISKQGKRFVAHSPALDISTSGKSEAEAKSRFTDLIPLFFEELDAAGTTDDVLSELGWKKDGVARTSGWKPPVTKNEQMQVRIPVAA